jgi:hypothetical protein
MRNRTKQNFYFYYLLENTDSKFLYTVRNCKSPERTKQYKKLEFFLYRNIVKSIGYCDQGYFQTNSPKFIAPNLTYLKIN